MSDRDYYEILGLMPGADGAIVDQSYWHLARKYQAQAETDPRARQQLDDLNEAYGVLGNARLRQQYDDFRADVLVVSGAGVKQRHGERARGSGLPGFIGRVFGRRAKSEQALGDTAPPVFAADAALAPRRAASITASRRLGGADDDLRASTAALIGRWRSSAGINAPVREAAKDQSPDTTLVDIFRSEHEMEEPSEPLYAVMDILRGSKEPVDSR